MAPEKVTGRIGSLIKLRPEYEERYIFIHKYVFPGVLERIRRSNIRNYSIFLRGGVLFSYFEYIGKNYEADMEIIGDSVTRDWWRITDPMQVPFANRKKGEWWTSMEILHHSEQNYSYRSDIKRHALTAEIKSGSQKNIYALFSNFDKEFGNFYKQAHMLNHNVFMKDCCIFIYIEYTGQNFSADEKNLYDNTELKKWNDELNINLKSDRFEMKEIFHTN